MSYFEMPASCSSAQRWAAALPPVLVNQRLGRVGLVVEALPIATHRSNDDCADHAHVVEAKRRKGCIRTLWLRSKRHRVRLHRVAVAPGDGRPEGNRQAFR
jgi:hypothetical protein